MEKDFWYLQTTCSQDTGVFLFALGLTLKHYFSIQQAEVLLGANLNGYSDLQLGD
jgi:hypothetical protein